MADKSLSNEAFNIETRLVHGSKGFDPHTGAVSFPIYQSATFRHPGPNQTTGYDYSRLQNPTREELENTMSILENGSAGFAFSSGMAAITAVMELFDPGDHILVSDDLYGGTYRLFEEICKRHGLEFTYLDTSDTDTVRRSIRKNTRAVFIETPSNPMMKVTDIKAVSDIAREAGMLTIVDNTFLTPYLQRPLEHGADIVLHSGTKYLGGHNDTLAGFIVTGDSNPGPGNSGPGNSRPGGCANLSDRLKLIQKTTGAVLPPFDSWLVLRGIKTLGVRLEKQERNARRVAEWLKGHRLVEKVYYAGLPDHEGYETSRKQSSGFGAMISFRVKDRSQAEKILGNVKLVAFAESLGGVESLITYPIVQTHSAIPKELRDRLGVDEKLLRLSIGIEAADDIISDLEQAINA